MPASGGSGSSDGPAGEQESGTGSDTEWSEGFSSDGSHPRARPRKRERLLARAAREQLSLASREHDREGDDDSEADADVT